MDYAPVLLGKPTEDFLLELKRQPRNPWKTRVHDHVPPALCEAVAHLCEEFTAAYLLDCLVLHKGIQCRLPKPAQAASCPRLSQDERSDRYGMLLSLWAGGCTTAIDEGLFLDAAHRRPREYDALRQRFRRKPLCLATHKG